MDIDADTLGIPDTEYDASVIMPSSEFARIVRDLSGLGESVKIEVSKDGVRFSSDGESANGNILLKQTESARRRFAHVGKRNKKETTEDGEDDDAGGEEEDDKKKKKKKAVKKEQVKEETGDVEMANGDGEDDGDEEFQAKSEDEGEDEQSDEEASSSKKRKKAPAKVRASSSPFTPSFITFSVEQTDKEGKKILRGQRCGGRRGRRAHRDEPDGCTDIQFEIPRQLFQILESCQGSSAHVKCRRTAACESPPPFP